jgi:DNA polymerase
MENRLEKLALKVENCQKCELWKTRKKSVFGEGPENSKILLIGLGPGYYEDQKGIPFVGAAGQYLNELLKLAGWRRRDIYITNIMKSYLPDNRATTKQIQACTPFLDKQIDIIRPELIILLGNVATEYVFKKFGLSLSSMSNLHGRIFSIPSLFGTINIIPMYHPAAALRNPSLRDIIANDWRTMPEKLNNLQL